MSVRYRPARIAAGLYLQPSNDLRTVYLIVRAGSGEWDLLRVDSDTTGPHRLLGRDSEGRLIGDARTAHPSLWLELPSTVVGQFRRKADAVLYVQEGDAVTGYATGDVIRDGDGRFAVVLVVDNGEPVLVMPTQGPRARQQVTPALLFERVTSGIEIDRARAVAREEWGSREPLGVQQEGRQVNSNDVQEWRNMPRGQADITADPGVVLDRPRRTRPVDATSSPGVLLLAPADRPVQRGTGRLSGWEMVGGWRP